MPAVSETIVREYLEGLGFLVQQPRKYVVMARSKQPAEEIDFLAVNPLAGTDYQTPEPGQMLAGGAELRQCPRIMVSAA